MDGRARKGRAAHAIALAVCRNGIPLMAGCMIGVALLLSSPAFAAQTIEPGRLELRLAQQLLSTIDPADELHLGPRLRLGLALPGPAEGEAPKCIAKKHGTIKVCVTEAGWPADIERVFRVDTVLYRGTKVLARYIDNLATRYFAYFPSEAYSRVAAYFESVYGPPQMLWQRTAMTAAGETVDNPVTVWRKTDQASGAVSYLEVRRYDDIRHDFADKRLGAVRLYTDGTDPVFAGISTGNFLVLR